MLPLRDGGILFVYTHYRGGTDADDAGADLFAMRSDDGGESFQPIGTVLDHRSVGAMNTMSVSLLRMRDMSIGLFFLLRRSGTDLRMHLMRSYDEGLTWSAPVCCMPLAGYYVVDNDRVIQLASGRIIIPAAQHESTLSEGGTVHFDSRSRAVFFFSDDDGVSWRRSPGYVALPVFRACASGLQEPGLLELRPGLLWCWCRTDLGRQYQAFSFDDGMTWTSPEPSAFTSPLAPMSVKELPDGRLLAVWDPVPLYNGRSERVGELWTGGRTPLACAFVDRSTLSPGPLLLLETDPDSGFCYTSILSTGNSVLLSYCAGTQGDRLCLDRLRVRKIGYEELDRDGHQDRIG